MYLLFFLVWVILNGKITLEICLFGLAISTCLFAFICKFMDYSIRKERLLFQLAPLFIRYFWLLVTEIVKANLCVLKLILSPRLQPEPCLVHFTTDLPSGLSKVMLANSITLTPGTITVSVEGNEFLVHCLDEELAAGIEESVFIPILKEMEAKGGITS